MIKVLDNSKKMRVFLCNKKQLKKRIKIIILFCVLMLLTIDLLKFRSLNKKFNDLSSITYSVISYPIFLIQNKYLEIKNYLFVLSSYRNLDQENQNLKKQVRNLELLTVENNDLKKLVNFKDNFVFSKVTSRPVIVLFEGLKKQYLLNIGAVNGIKKGNAVVNNDKLIGRVIELSKKSSKIQLLTDKNSKIPVIILGTGYSGVASGQNNKKSLKLFYLPQEVDIKDGKAVITSGEGGYVPYGIYVGKTKQIKDEVFIDISSDDNKVLSLISVLKLEENFSSAKTNK